MEGLERMIEFERRATFLARKMGTIKQMNSENKEQNKIIDDQYSCT